MSMEDWKDDIMNSLDGMQKATPSTDLFEQIQQEIRTKKPKRVYLPQWTSVAAVLFLVVGMNAYLLSKHFKEAANESTEDFYMGNSSTYNLYEQ